MCDVGVSRYRKLASRPVSRFMGRVSVGTSQIRNKGLHRTRENSPSMLRRGAVLLSVLAVLLSVLAVARPGSSLAVPVAGPVGTYRNPVLPSDFPDPFILDERGVYFAYATNANGPNIQVVSSPDLRHWQLYRHALPSLPARAVAGVTWAPSVLKTGDGNYVLYYTARDRGSGLSCIGRAF